MSISLIIILIVLILWSLWGYFSSNVEQARYTVLEKKNGYEIRSYPKHIVAQTTVVGDYRTSLNTGFRIVAGYIFGGNIKKEGIAMTAPVVAREPDNSSDVYVNEKIAMTSPVVATKVSVNNEVRSRVISFGMPHTYTTLESLPIPTDNRVKLVEILEEKYAVKRFSWLATEKRVDGFEKQLIEQLEKDNIETLGTVAYAGYNAPWTPPWMRRQEVLVKVK